MAGENWWKLQNANLAAGLCEMFKRHTQPRTRQRPRSSFLESGESDRRRSLLSQTMEQISLPQWTTWVHCFGHVLNLTVKECIQNTTGLENIHIHMSHILSQSSLLINRGICWAAFKIGYPLLNFESNLNNGFVLLEWFERYAFSHSLIITTPALNKTRQEWWG